MNEDSRKGNIVQVSGGAQVDDEVCVDEVDKGFQVDYRVQRIVLLLGSVQWAIVCADG